MIRPVNASVHILSNSKRANTIPILKIFRLAFCAPDNSEGPQGIYAKMWTPSIADLANTQIFSYT
jgi:hypothetical protein